MSAGTKPERTATVATGVAGQWLERLFGELWAESHAADYGLPQLEFLRILAEVGAKYLPANAAPGDATALYRSLRVEELAIARACAAGNEHAWEVFLSRFREKLFDAGRAIARNDATGRELADSLYADLYGTELRDGQRRSKLLFYMGRGSLEGWLRTVLAQEFVNRYRSQKKLVSLEEENEEGVQFAAPVQEGSVVVDPRLEAAVDAALAALPAEDRYVLASYFLDQRTLAEVARTLAVHESTISRKLDKLTAQLRKHVLDALVKRGMSRRQAEEALAADVRDLQVDIRARLAQDSAAAPFSKKEGS
ncbi:MAG: sigma-70 family RNA polymerase sigma factor [Acidobacteriota bacterium]|nr:sigma-70 family RNA polymerase sigma factor [Acidobacteriota bacterium]